MTTQTEIHPRFFALDRDEDASQVSGTGRVAYAIDFTAEGGDVLLVWDTQWQDTLDFRPSMAVLEDIHGHGGATRITPLEPGVDDPAIERARELLAQVRARAAATLRVAELAA